MAQDFIHVRVDSAKKREAERILNELGLNLSTGINLCISGIIRAKGLPFDVKLSRREILGDKTYNMEMAFQKSVDDTIERNRAAGFPIALYDTDKGRLYFEYPDGRREYHET